MNLGIVITTYNRPQYLKQCFESIAQADLPEGTHIFIIDDCSTEREANKLIHSFTVKGCRMHRLRKPQRKGIRDSLLRGFDLAFAECDLVMNLDSDAIVKSDFARVLTDLKKRFPNEIITGFNCVTKNRNGSERHPIVKSGKGYNIKKTVGGINMLLDRSLYQKHVKPALLNRSGNWDHQTCINSKGAICSVPSVVQHIGFHSSMGHHLTGEPVDVADDFKRISLPNVTLVGVSTNEGAALHKAAAISSRDIEFGDTVLLTSRIKIQSKADYNKFVLKELVNYIKTDYFLIIQPDGYLLNWKAWTNDFLKYDYIGAVWNWYRDKHRVGNGGFSLRSKRLHEILRDDHHIVPANDNLINNFEEDHNIARIYRTYLETKYDIKFAPEPVANRFSIEAFATPDKRYKGQLGFHGTLVDFTGAEIAHIPYKKR